MAQTESVLREYLTEADYFMSFQIGSGKSKADAWRIILADVKDYAWINVLPVIFDDAQYDLCTALVKHLGRCSERSRKLVAQRWELRRRGISEASPEYGELDNGYVSDAKVLFAELVRLVEKAISASNTEEPTDADTSNAV